MLQSHLTHHHGHCSAGCWGRKVLHWEENFTKISKKPACSPNEGSQCRWNSETLWGIHTRKSSRILFWYKSRQISCYSEHVQNTRTSYVKEWVSTCFPERAWILDDWWRWHGAMLLNYILRKGSCLSKWERRRKWYQRKGSSTGGRWGLWWN